MSRTPAAEAAGTLFSTARERVVVMGILNVTPDSFSGDGLASRPEDLVERARAFAAAGADVVDIGAESTRPGAPPVGAEEELARLLPAVEAVRAAIGLPLSADTYKAAVAARAVAAGAAIVNDVWGLQKDPEMAETVAEAGAGLIIMHNREAADEAVDIVDDICRFFERSLGLADAAGIDPGRIALDPGIGFGKTWRQNLVVLNRLDRLARFEKPLLVGLSRKRFIGWITGRPVEERLAGTIAANLAAVAKGAAMIRVHDVAEHVEALAVTAAIGRESHG